MHRLVLFLNRGWKAMKVECCGCWVQEEPPTFGIWKNLKPCMRTSWFLKLLQEILCKRWIKRYLFGWIEVQQRWTSAKVSVACRAHFQYRLRSYHVCTQLSGSNCSAATDLKCCQKNTPKLHKWLIFQRKRLKHLSMSISPLIFSIQLTQ